MFNIFVLTKHGVIITYKHADWNENYSSLGAYASVTLHTSSNSNIYVR